MFRICSPDESIYTLFKRSFLKTSYFLLYINILFQNTSPSYFLLRSSHSARFQPISPLGFPSRLSICDAYGKRGRNENHLGTLTVTPCSRDFPSPIIIIDTIGPAFQRLPYTHIRVCDTTGRLFQT